MKRKIPLRLRQTTPALAMASIPTAALAQSALASIPAVEMSLTAYLIIAFLLVLSIMMFFLFQHRFHKAATELKGVTAELGGTRQRLVEANRQLEVSQKEHQATERRYQNILFDAKTGMFQMDLAGKCTYLNTAMQEMSGLYPKKALKEGLASAIHPDDRAAFHAAWRAFADGNAEFDQVFRFLHAKGREVHVACRVNKVYDAKKEVESYIGWAADVTEFHAAQLQERAATERYEHFVGETIEGFYKLAPPTPIALTGDPREI
uniref:PAS domain-containing protein n=1 Tax=Pontiella sp. TaxID=2837462 RepID=UPI00356B55E8